ncbi:MAG: hypothetical protein M3Y58_19895, partial [Chloroflexota bacterium]|nr:hypothetical protein [Chloroflexota bacterium]
MRAVVVIGGTLRCRHEHREQSAAAMRHPPRILALMPMHVKQAPRWYLFRDEGRRYAAGMIDLKTASRDALIRLIVSQHEMIARQERV